LKLVARARPHVVILDVEMPGMTGVEVLASLRALDPTIPVIMLTANTDGSVAAETLKLGAVSYAPKPLDVRYSRSPRCDVRDETPQGLKRLRKPAAPHVLSVYSRRSTGVRASSRSSSWR